MSLTMTEEEWGWALTAYRRGLAADMIQLGESGDGWDTIWTVPPCSPTALERATRQAVRCHAARVRHVRRARLRPHGDGRGSTVEVVIVTEAAPVVQVVRELSSERVLLVGSLLAEEGLRALLGAVASYPVGSGSRP